MQPKYPNVTVALVGEDGNAFAILARCRTEAKHAGLSKRDLDSFTREATAGDYEHLLQTVMRWFDVT